jgi:2-polyprenyl-3-methyl-5-hydroxy-6-metoxy-1,4-benzoquinol methylase
VNPSAVDRVLRAITRPRFAEVAEERAYWQRFWTERLDDLSRTGVPFEERVAWERDCDVVMADHYAGLWGGVAGRSVAELGCGSGHISLLLAARGAEVTLVDYSPLALEYAEATARYLGVLDRVRFEQADMFTVQLPTHDYVYNCGVVEHYEDGPAVELVQRMAALATRAAAVTVPNLLAPEMLHIMFRYGKGSERYFTPATLARLVTGCGLVAGRRAAVPYWAPSFLGADLAARIHRAVPTHWTWSWLFTQVFTARQPPSRGEGW